MVKAKKPNHLKPNDLRLRSIKRKRTQVDTIQLRFYKANPGQNLTFVFESACETPGSASTSFKACLKPLLACVNKNLLRFSATILLNCRSGFASKWFKKCSFKKPRLAINTHLTTCNDKRKIKAKTNQNKLSKFVKHKRTQ